MRGMLRDKRGLFFLLGAVILVAAVVIVGAVAFAQDADYGSATVRKTKNNLNFQVPPDWPIEERAGMVAPIPIEEYLARKFQNLDLRLRTIEQSLNGFDLRIRVLEEKLKEKDLGLRSTEARFP